MSFCLLFLHNLQKDGAIKKKLNMDANKKRTDEHKKQSSTITESNHKLLMYS